MDSDKPGDNRKSGTTGRTLVDGGRRLDGMQLTLSAAVSHRQVNASKGGLDMKDTGYI